MKIMMLTFAFAVAEFTVSRSARRSRKRGFHGEVTATTWSCPSGANTRW